MLPRGSLPINAVFSYFVDTVSLCPVVHTVHQIILYQPVNVKRWEKKILAEQLQILRTGKAIYRKCDVSSITP